MRQTSFSVMLAFVLCVASAAALQETSSLNVVNNTLEIAVYQGSDFNVNLLELFTTVPGARFAVNETSLKIGNIDAVNVTFSLPFVYSFSKIQAFSVVPRRTEDNETHPTLYVSTAGKLLEYDCEYDVSSNQLVCPKMPTIHYVSNVFRINRDLNVNLTFIYSEDPSAKSSYIQVARGYNASDIIYKANFYDFCRRYLFQSKVSQFICLRESGVSLDGYTYTYTNGTFSVNETNFTATSNAVPSIDDFILPDQFENNGVIRSGTDVVFIRSEVTSNLTDPFGNHTTDYTLYSVYPKLILVAEKLGKIRQYDFSSIYQVNFEGEYDLHSCRTDTFHRVATSHQNNMLYVTCDDASDSSVLQIYDITTRNLRRRVPVARSIKRTSLFLSLFEIAPLNFDVLIDFQNPSVNALRVHYMATLSGATSKVLPIHATNMRIVDFNITAQSSIFLNQTVSMLGRVYINFCERPINQLKEQIDMNATRIIKDAYAVNFSSAELFYGSVHNYTFKRLDETHTGAQRLHEDDSSFEYIPNTGYVANISIPSISSDEIIYDYHYTPISPKNGDTDVINNGTLVVLTKGRSRYGATYISVFNATRTNSCAFEAIEFVNKFEVGVTFCQTLTVVNMGEFTLENLFGFVQCQSIDKESFGSMAVYGFSLLNGSKILDQVITSAQAFITFTFDDVRGFIVVVHSQIDGVPNFAEFLQFYPIGPKYSNPVRTIPFEGLNLDPNFNPTAADLLVNSNSETVELLTIDQSGILVYCSTPIKQTTSGVTFDDGRKEFCVVKQVTDMLNQYQLARPPQWTGVQIIKRFSTLSSKYTVDYFYSNGLTFVLNTDSFNAYMFQINQQIDDNGLTHASETSFQILKGFAGYFPDYKKLTFFDIDERYIVFVAHTSLDSTTVVYIIYDHTLNETNTNFYYGYNGTLSTYPILEAIAGYRYQTADVGMSPTRVFLENPTTTHRRLITLGPNNNLLQFRFDNEFSLVIRGEWEVARFNVSAENDHYKASTILEVHRPATIAAY